MGPAAAITRALRRYADFSDRSSGPEFWWFLAFGLTLHIVGHALDALIFGGGTAALDLSPRFPFTIVFTLFLVTPLIATGFRRLHDTGRPGWPVLIPYALIAGGAIVAYFGILGVGPVAEAGAPQDDFVGETSAGGGRVVAAFVVMQLFGVLMLLYLAAKGGDLAANAYGAPPPR